MTNRKIILAVLGLLIVLAILGSIMRSQVPLRIDLPFDLTSTTLAAEFASSSLDINSVLGSDRRYAVAIEQQQYIDFPFIACYVALFVILGLALRHYDFPGARTLAWTAIVCAVAAGLFDIGENISIIRTATSANPLSSPVRYFSVPKWSLVFLVMLIESTIFFFWPALTLWWRIAGAGVGLLLLFAGASGLLFSLLVSVNDIAWSAGWMNYALIAMLIFLLAQVLLPVALARTRRLRY